MRLPVLACAIFVLAAPTALAQTASSAVVFRWQKIPGAVSYEIEVSEDKSFANVIIQESTTTNSYSWHRLARRSYYWRVRAVDGSGRKGRFSGPRKVGLVVEPAELASPKDGARFAMTAQKVMVKLSWKRSALLSNHTIEISTDPLFSASADKATLSGTQHQFSATKPGDYFWRVSSEDLNGQAVRGKAVRRFAVFVAAPTATAPATDATVPWTATSNEVQLSWSARPVKKYEVQLESVDAPGTAIVSPRTSDTDQRVTLPAPGTYSWRVRGVSPNTSWSERRQFTAALPVPTPHQPASDETLSPTETVVFAWSPVDGASEYAVELRRLDDDASPVMIKQEPTSTVEWTKLDPGTYEWTVSAIDALGVKGAASPAATFSVAEPITAPPVVEAPMRVVSVAAPPTTHGTLWAGPRLQVFHNLGEILVPRAGLEVGYRPLWRSNSLYINLVASYFTATAAATDPVASIDYESRLHALPIDVGLSWVTDIGPVEAYAGVGLSMAWVYATVATQTQPTRTSSSLQVGGGAHAGAQRQLGPGNAYLELGFAKMSKLDGIVQAEPGGVTAGIGYRLKVWQ